MRSRSGFTLVELLVVVTIITVLAAMLLPTLEASIMQARIASCANNLRQQGCGLSLYAGDNEGFWPYRIGDNMEFERWAREYTYGPPYIDFHNLIASYIQPGPVYACPATTLNWRDYWRAASGSGRYVWPGYQVFAGSINLDGTRRAVVPWTTTLTSQATVAERWKSVSPLRSDLCPDRPIIGDSLFYSTVKGNDPNYFLDKGAYCYSASHSGGRAVRGITSAITYSGNNTVGTVPQTNNIYSDLSLKTYTSGFSSCYFYSASSLYTWLYWHRKE